MITKTQPVVFRCRGDRLLGMIHRPASPSRMGIVIIVGGPQYRVGSHRQFVILARLLAHAGFPVLRFDYRGMGDSEGRTRTFEDVGEDLRAAVDCMNHELPKLRHVVLLGLCDAASAILINADNDPRILGQVLLNPWVRTERTEAATYLRHYYVQRLLQASFWRKFFSGRFRWSQSFTGALQTLRSAGARHTNNPDATPFVERMLHGLRTFNRPTLFLLSGNDLTAREFSDLCTDSEAWKQAMRRPTITIRKYETADHTFSAASDLKEASEGIVRWLRDLRTIQTGSP